MQSKTRSFARSMIVAILTALAALIIGTMQSLTTAVTASLGLSAYQAIIVPGTGTPDPYAPDRENYLNNALNYYVVPGGNCVFDAPAGACPTTTGVKYYATFWPIPLPGWGGLEGQKWNVSVADGVQNLTTIYNTVPDGDSVTVFGYSQGATVANIFKAAHPQPAGYDGPETNYFFIGDPQRPSGGLFERLAFLGNVPILDAQFGQPSPTDTCEDGNRICATDFALMYDGVADFPQWLANPVAVLNAVAGFQYIHGTYLAPDSGEPATDTPYGYTPQEVQDYVAAAQATGGCTAANYCQHVPGSDTIYVTLPARYLPIYQPFVDLGDATGTSGLIVPVTDFLSPFTQTIIETGYDRTNYANPQPGTILPPKTFNPIKTAVDLVNDIPEGINMALTPGRTPLPGSPPVQTTMTTLSDTSGTNQSVLQTATISKPGAPDIRLGLFAKPGESATATGTNGSSADRPLQNALKDFHPVRDVVKAVSGTVKKAIGGKDGNSSAAGGDTNSED